MTPKPPLLIVSPTDALPHFTIPQLREKTSWIRDGLEPGIALEGPRTLEADTVLELHDFFTRLRVSNLDFAEIQQSRIHKAILLVAGRGTRWPKKLVDTCDLIVAEWTERFGNLNAVWPILYGPGGRLQGVGEPKGLSRHAVVLKWMADPTLMVSPLRALEHGNLEFHPGQWWIHPLFAFRDGIIDSPDSHGGITVDHDGVYAITLTGYDEVDGEAFGVITYRCRTHDRSKHRLLRAFLPPKQPLRILRSHTLHSIWSPVAGLRYDGLYRIIGYSWRFVEGEPTLDVNLERQLGQISMATVLSHPTAEEIEDYVEYKRLQEIRRQKQETPEHAHQKVPVLPPPQPRFNSITYSNAGTGSPKSSKLKDKMKLPRPPLREAYGSEESVMQVVGARRRGIDAFRFGPPATTESSIDELGTDSSTNEPHMVPLPISAADPTAASSSKPWPRSPKSVSIAGTTDGTSENVLDHADREATEQDLGTIRRDSGVAMESPGHEVDAIENFTQLPMHQPQKFGLFDESAFDEFMVENALEISPDAVSLANLGRKCEHLYEQIALRSMATADTLQYLQHMRAYLHHVDTSHSNPELLQEFDRLEAMIDDIEDEEGFIPCEAEDATRHFLDARNSIIELRRRRFSKQYKLCADGVRPDILEESWECPIPVRRL